MFTSPVPAYKGASTDTRRQGNRKADTNHKGTVSGGHGTRLLVLVAALSLASGQEVQSGFAIPFTLTGAAMHSHRGENEGASTVQGGFRAMLYPQVKLGPHWFGYAAIQIHQSPFFYEEAFENEREFEVHILQAYAGYSLVSGSRAITFKAGQLISAFGSFLPRYDDARNSLIDLPPSYGYYYKPVTSYGMPGVEANIVLTKTDLRFQFTNSSPANPRHLWDGDQYGSWTVGGGYSIRQSFRIGGSMYRGPYLDRHHRFFFPGESPPKRLPATGLGVDIQYAHGRYTLNGEWQRFQFDYTRIPNFVTTTGYAEAKVTLNPRWYLALRTGWRRANLAPAGETVEVALGFRPASHHLVKIGYAAAPARNVSGARDNVFGVQYVVSFNPPAVAF